MDNDAEILWQPGESELTHSTMARYRDWLVAEGFGDFSDYPALYRWSINELERFWESIWRFTGVIASRPYDEVLSSHQMPGAQWFNGARLNFAENLLRHALNGPTNKILVRSLSESRAPLDITAAALLDQVAALQGFLLDHGVRPGERVAAVVANSHEALIGMLATTGLGAVWTAAAPEFGTAALIDRFGQIEPRVLLAVNGYAYGGKTHERNHQNLELISALPGLRAVLGIANLPTANHTEHPLLSDWDQMLERYQGRTPHFEQLPPDHPVYILYSSGTTGVPKCIVHGASGMLLNHSKELLLHADIRPDDYFFYFTTTGWMMWNWLVSGLLSGARLVLYDGSPGFPDLGALWRLAEREHLTQFGTSAKFLAGCRKAGIAPGRDFDLSALRTIFSTGSPLMPEDFDWVYREVKTDVMLSSISGGTDICGCFVGGAPLLPVRRGEIQCRLLGVAAHAYTPEGKEAGHERGELVCTRPLPAMPVGFWNDPNGMRYRQSYFDKFPGVWAHGDFVRFTETGGAIIYGRSDATLNPGGVRIGTAEIYRLVEAMNEIADSLVVGEPTGEGDVRVLLLVVLTDGHALTPTLEKAIKTRLRENASPRHVPARILAIQAVPYTRSGKKVELAVTRLFDDPNARDGASVLANPEALDEIAAILKRPDMRGVDTSQ